MSLLGQRNKSSIFHRFCSSNLIKMFFLKNETLSFRKTSRWEQDDCSAGVFGDSQSYARMIASRLDPSNLLILQFESIVSMNKSFLKSTCETQTSCMKHSSYLNVEPISEIYVKGLIMSRGPSQPHVGLKVVSHSQTK